jgi:hypothetical protein
VLRNEQTTADRDVRHGADDAIAFPTRDAEGDSDLRHREEFRHCSASRMLTAAASDLAFADTVLVVVIS